MSPSPLSVQLYTVRESLQDDLDGTLSRIAGIGFSRVEPYNFTAFPGLGESLAAHGLSAPTTHAKYLGEGDAVLETLFSAAKALGIQRVIDPHVPEDQWQSAETIAATAQKLNAAAKIAASVGVDVGYHNHAHELRSVIDGTTALELFAQQLDPEVGLEVDTYWAAVGGQDPVALLGRLGQRVVALHVKDGPATDQPKDQVAVGSGTLPIREIIAAAPQALAVIELDDSQGDRFTAVEQSFAFLSGVVR